MAYKCYLEDFGDVLVSIDYEPAQNGGYTDPSWDASYTIEDVTDHAGLSIVEALSEDQRNDLENQIDTILEEIALDMNDGGDDYDD